MSHRTKIRFQFDRLAKKVQGGKRVFTEGESRKTKSFCRQTWNYSPDFFLHMLMNVFVRYIHFSKSNANWRLPRWVQRAHTATGRPFKDRTYQKIFGLCVRVLLLQNCSCVILGLTTQPCLLQHKAGLSVKNALKYLATCPLQFPSLLLCAGPQVNKQRPDLSRGHSVSSVPWSSLKWDPLSLQGSRSGSKPDCPKQQTHSPFSISSAYPCSWL